MKEVIALQEYTDKYVSFYEGEIRNITDDIADKLITKGIVRLHTDIPEDGGSGGGGGGTSGVLALHSDENATLDKTFREIVEAIDEGKFVFISGVNGEPEDYERWFDLITDTSYNSMEQKYYVGFTSGNLYAAASLDDYPTWVEI